MTELWVPVPVQRFAPFYLVSSEGRIRSLDRLVREHSGKERLQRGRTITAKNTGDYLGVSLFYEGKGTRFYLHRLVAEAFLPNPENKPCVNHLNFNHHDNRATNLEWATHKENSEHSGKHGRLGCKNPIKGSNHPSARFTEAEIRELRLSWQPGDSISELAQDYGVSYRALYKILGGISWKHVCPSRALSWPDTPCDRHGVRP